MEYIKSQIGSVKRVMASGRLEASIVIFADRILNNFPQAQSIEQISRFSQFL